MEFTYIEDGIDAIVVDNFYTPDQLAEIKTELNWLTKQSIFSGESELAPATVDGIPLTSKRGVFLETVFRNWKHSALISHSMRQMSDPKFVERVLSYNSLYKTLFACNSRAHLLSYYENCDYYKPHTDSFFYTVLSYFNTEPKQFSGGEIVLKSHNSTKEATIEPVNNRVVIIASCTLHEVKELKSQLNNTYSGDGRYCNAIFLTYIDQRQIQNDSN